MHARCMHSVHEQHKDGVASLFRATNGFQVVTLTTSREFFIAKNHNSYELADSDLCRKGANLGRERQAETEKVGGKNGNMNAFCKRNRDTKGEEEREKVEEKNDIGRQRGIETVIKEDNERNRDGKLGGGSGKSLILSITSLQNLMYLTEGRIEVRIFFHKENAIRKRGRDWKLEEDHLV